MPLSDYDSSPSKKPKRRKKPAKRKKHHWYSHPLEIGDRWLEGAGDAVAGIPSLAKMLGEAYIERAKQVADGDIAIHVNTKPGPGDKLIPEDIGYQLLKGEAKHWKDFLGPLLPGGKEQGNWRKTLRFADKHPFDVSMDALIPVGGAGWAGKAAKAGATARFIGEGSAFERALARVAGLEKVEAPSSVLEAERIKLRGGKVSADGTRAFEPKTLKVPTSMGVPREVTLDSNPLTRAVQTAAAKAGSKAPLRSLPIIGSDRRLGREIARPLEQDKVMDQLTSEREILPSERAMRGKRREDERIAAYVRSTGMTAESAAKAAANRVEKAVEAVADPKHAAEWAAMKKMVDPDALAKVGPVAASKVLREKKTAAIEHFKQAEEAALDEARNLRTQYAATADKATRKRLQKRINSFQSKAAAARASRAAAVRVKPHKDSYVNRYNQLKRNTSLADETTAAVAEPLNKARALQFSNERVRKLVENPTKRMLRFEEEARKLAEDSTKRLTDEGVRVRDERPMLEALQDMPERFAKTPKEAAADSAKYESLVQKIADEGREANPAEMSELSKLGSPFSKEAIDSFKASGESGVAPYTWPHFARTLENASRSEMRRYRDMALSLDQVHVVGNARLNSGWLHDLAMVGFEPRNIRKAHSNIVSWQHEKIKTQKIMELLIQEGDEGYLRASKNPALFVDVVGDPQFRRYADSVAQFFREDAPTILGDAQKSEIDELTRMFDDGLLRMFEKGKPVYLPRVVARELKGNLQRSEGTAMRVFDGLTNGWRHFALNLSGGRWVANNIVGQFMLMAASYGLVRSTYNLLLMAGDSIAARAAGRESKYSLIARKAPQIETSGFAHQEMMGSPDAGRFKRTITAPGNLVGWVNGVLSDDIPRRTAFWIEVKPSVKRLVDSGEAVDVADALGKILADPATAHRLTDKVIKSLVDFRDLSPFERQWMRRAIPFYSWIKGSAVRAKSLAFEQPFKTLAATRGSEYAVGETEKKYGGELPKFLKGQIVLKDGKKQKRILTTTGFNPFVTPVDTVTQLGSMFQAGTPSGTDSLLASVNPWLKSAMEGYTNRDLFYGGKIDYKDESSPSGRIWQRTKQQFPQYMTWHKYQYAKNPPKGYKSMYVPSTADVLLQLAGLPIKTVKVDEARKRGRDEKSGKNQRLL